MHLAVAETQLAASLVAVEIPTVVADNLVGNRIAVVGTQVVVGNQSDSLAAVVAVVVVVVAEAPTEDNWPDHLTDKFAVDFLVEELVAENQPAE